VTHFGGIIIACIATNLLRILSDVSEMELTTAAKKRRKTRKRKVSRE
jgi:hypothetical protein